MIIKEKSSEVRDNVVTFLLFNIQSDKILPNGFPLAFLKRQRTVWPLQNIELRSIQMSKGFSGLIEKVNTCGVKKVAVAVAQDAHVLEAVRAAKERNIAEAILVGDKAKIEEVAAGIGMDLSGYEVIHVEEPYEGDTYPAY